MAMAYDNTLELVEIISGSESFWITTYCIHVHRRVVVEVQRYPQDGEHDLWSSYRVIEVRSDPSVGYPRVYSLDFWSDHRNDMVFRTEEEASAFAIMLKLRS